MNKVKVLLLSHKNADIMLIKKIQQSIDVEFLIANGKKNVLQLLKENDCAFVILDAQVPEVDSYDIAASLRSDPKTECMPIIFLAEDNVSKAEIHKAYAIGIADYIIKPIDEIVLLGKLQCLFDMYKKRQDLESLKNKAEDANRVKLDFLANMSHEIRTPLNGIIGITEILLGEDMNAEQYKKINTILYSGETLLQLINNFLDFSKMESEEIIHEDISFDLYTLIRELADVLSIKSYTKRVEFIFNYSKDVPHIVYGDPVRIKQIMYNLVGNAIKFTDRGFIKVNVDARKIQDDEYEFIISVTDSGIGIADDKHTYVFDKFIQVNDSQKRQLGGTGLGLAICKTLIESMGGDITLESALGKGSTFTVKLPMCVDTEKSNKISNHDNSLEGLRVLVIDDSKVVREYLTSTIGKLGAEVSAADSANNAISKLSDGIKNNQPYHVALVDFVMPDIDGIDFGAMIKSSDELCNTLLIMMTAYPKKGIEVDLIKGGFAGYLNKPIRAELINKMLSTIWEAYKSGDKIELITQHILENNEFNQVPQRNSTSFIDKKVLLVEDNRTNRAMAHMMLEGFGCEVEEATNGKEAILKVLKHHYDLILMDCQMPIMDGYEASQKIKELMEKGKVPLCSIIAFTANAMKGDKEKCFAAGMHDYISKPVYQKDIKNILAKWLT